MTERRITLLQFAIAASLAVLPVMLGVLLLVGEMRPTDRDAAPDRYISVRHVAALKTFEQAVVQRNATTAPPTAAQLLDGLPRCRRDWSPSWRTSTWLPQALRSRQASAAEQVAAQLAAFDAALQRFSTRANTRVSHAVGLDAARWFAAADKSLAQPIESAAYEGQRFHLRCSDLADALSALLRADARMLEALAWRGTEASTTLARWRPEQQMEVTERHVMRRNPWHGIAGCIYLGDKHFVAGPRSVQNRLCTRPELAGDATPSALAGEPRPADAADDTRWSVPPSLHTLLQPLDGLRQPSHALYRLYTDDDAAGYRFGPNRIVLDGAAVDVGFSLRLTIDPALQALAQKTAACYTGRHDICRALGVRRAEDGDKPLGQRLLEGAMVRMAAVAVIDVASGRIEALAGALSPCARQEFDGPGRDAQCDKRLPYPVQYRPDALMNPAVFHDAMPASTIKPIMAAAFLSDPEVGRRWLAAERAAIATTPERNSLRGQLMRSDSARFLDRMFCLDKNFADCTRPWAVQKTALAFGWNAGCADASLDCGKHDLLFGRVIDASAEAGVVRPLATPVAYGRLLSEPERGKLVTAMHLMPASAFNAAIVRHCAFGVDGRRGSDDDWEKCRGAGVVDAAAEGWGQGHARASTLGVSGMMATLAAAANGQTQLRRPHLVDAVQGIHKPLALAVTRWGLAEPQPLLLARDAAEVIVSGLSYSHRAGTARTACEQVFDARRCRDFDWIAGKTGTPSFPSDGLSLDALARLCRGPQAAHTKPAACNSLRPHKWYVAAYRSPADHGPWTKAIAVLTERNWVRASGQVHGAGDHGPNPAAEIAMQIAGRHVGLLNGNAP